MKEMYASKVQGWNVVSSNVASLFTLIFIHFIDNIWILLVVAFLLEITISALRYLFFSFCVLIGRFLDRRGFFNMWAITTLIYFLIKGNWLLGTYALIYVYFIGPIFQMPSVYIWDNTLGKPDSRIYAYFKLKARTTGEEMPLREEMLEKFSSEPPSSEKEDILKWMGQG